MNKALFFLVLSALVSCTFQERKSASGSRGKINHISVIIDDQLWNGEVGDSIRNKFASPVIGLQQEEPLFTIDQYPAKFLEGFSVNTRSVIIVKQEAPATFEVKANQKGIPRNVVRISGRTIPEIVQLLEQHAPDLIRLMKDTEISETQKLLDSGAASRSRVPDGIGIEITIPEAYNVALANDSFTWFKKEIISGNTSILIYSVPAGYFSKDARLVENIVKMRDSIGNLYIHGTSPESGMITEEAYAPYLSSTIVRGRKTYETRGTWELKNDFMSGPFVNYAISDPENGRVLVLEGFCYAPSKDTRDLMHELEAIIRTVTFVKK